jgi:glycosyltransferase involved in cell wall biosynthesis
MRRVRVLQLLYDHGNAISQVCNEYSRALDRDRYEITVAYLYGAEEPEVIAGTDADTVLFLDLPKREPFGLRFKALFAVARLLANRKFDHVICHRYKTIRLAALVQRAQSIPSLLYVVHGIAYMAGWRRRLFAWCFCRRLKYVAVSEAVRQDLVRSVPGLDETRVFLVHNTIDLAALDQVRVSRAEARQMLGLAEDAFVFGTVGRLVSVKRHDLLIRALHMIADRAEDTVLVVIGGGKLAPKLRQLVADLGVGSRVELCGEHPQASRLMSAFDVFVFASREDSFGLVLIEAMAARLPIITAASGGVAEVVDQPAILVDDGTAEAFAAQMLKVYGLSAAELEALGAPGYERVRCRFANSAISAVLGAMETSTTASSDRIRV